MSHRARTKEQKFLLAIYSRGQQEGDLYRPFNRYEVGSAIGLQKRAIDVICRDLLQCNFLKKDGEEELHLTAQGEALAIGLLKN